MPHTLPPPPAQTCRKSRLYHSDAVRERVLGWFQRAYLQPSEAAVPIELQLRLEHDVGMVRLPCAGRRSAAVLTCG